jgi:hypothetical protein
MKNEASSREEAISACIQGYNPITCCKVWWRDPNGNWILLNSFSGVFGGNNLPIYSLPEKIDNKFIIVGKPFQEENGKPHNLDYSNIYNIENGEAYYKKIYFNEGDINIPTTRFSDYDLYGVNKKV